MQLTEIKNDLATINYSPEINKLMLSDFILIEDANQSILSQIISIEATMEDDVNSAMIKFLLSIDKEANLTQYNGYVPAKNADLILINPKEIVQLIKGSEKNIYLGDLAAYTDVPVEIGLDFFRKNPYIQVDFIETKLQITNFIIKGLEKHNKKALLFDFCGLYSNISLPTVTIGYNFKLPLNYEALCYIAEEELNEFSNENKAIIQGIIIEIQNYVKDLEDGFIPFDTLLYVLDEQYKENNMPELLILKNKLIKYQQQGIFAQQKSEFDFLDTYLKENKNFKFDLSELNSKWHKIAFISILNLIKTKCYIVSELTDDNSNKTIIKKLYEKNEFKPIVLSAYNYKYQIQVKSMSKNLILFKPLQKVNDFAGYTSFLNILGQDTYIIWGEQTLFIPLILKIPRQFIKFEQTQQNIAEKQENYQQINNSKSKDISEIETIDPISDNNEADASAFPEVIENEDITNVIDNETVSKDHLDNDIEHLEPTVFKTNETDVLTNEIEILENDYTNDELINDTESHIEKNEEEEEPEHNAEAPDDLPTGEDLDFFFEDADNITTESDNNSNNEIDITSDDNNDILEDNENILYQELEETIEDSAINSDQNTPESLEDIEINEDLTQIEDIEKNIKKTDKEDIEETVEESNEEKVEKATESNNIQIKKAAVPIYESKVAPQFDTKFAQGTYVHHKTYGRGVVVKVMKYREKQLCLIKFDNNFQRVVNPESEGLKQI